MKTAEQIAAAVLSVTHSFPTHPSGPDLRALMTSAIEADRAQHVTVDVVFDGPPAPKSGRFVEVEDMTGASVDAGEWIDRGDGLWALRFRRPEICLEQVSPDVLNALIRLGEAAARAKIELEAEAAL